MDGESGGWGINSDLCSSLSDNRGLLLYYMLYILYIILPYTSMY
jgi:hypothetical protein